MIEDTKKHIIKYLDKGIRYDGRKLEEYRDVKVETGIIETAEGSARVKMGETEVLVGIKFEVGEPYPDSPDKGTIMVNAELLPMANPDYESGPPGIDAIELARVVDRGIRESGGLDFKKLSIKHGELSWTVIIDVIPINSAGNLFDASSLGAVLALHDARFPELEGKKIDYKKLTDDKLPINELPVSVTVVKIGDHFIVDPIEAEEKVLDARLTVSTLKDGTICALQKAGKNPVTLDDIKTMVELGTSKGKQLRKHL